jgi:large conductance mechanosensitive channel
MSAIGRGSDHSLENRSPTTLGVFKTKEQSQRSPGRRFVVSERAAIPFGVRRPGWIDEFKAFIMRGNVVDLAVGIIIGVAFTAVVNSLVKDIFTPLIGLLVGGIDFTNIFVTLKGPSEATLAEAQKAGAVTLNIGVFFNAVIQFVIVSFAVFWLIKALTRLRVRDEPAAAAPPRSEVLLEEIRDLLAARSAS